MKEADCVSKFDEKGKDLSDRGENQNTTPRLGY